MDLALTEAVKAKFVALDPLFDERLRRRWAAVEARGIGRGGIARVAAATGMSRTTIRAGLKELAGKQAGGAGPESVRVRQRGAGRKRLTAHDQTLAQELERLVDPVTRGDPMGPLLWTCSSAAHLATELTVAGHSVSERTVNRLLHELGYSLQANRKTLEGKQHADRDEQFKNINRRVRAFQRLRQPVVSVDTKKKELIGQFRNGGREWRPQGDPERVKVHDFIDRELGKAIPYGVYDVTRDSGWVSVGEDHDTPAFAVGDAAEVVAPDGQGGVSGGQAAADHGRWGWFQQQSQSAVEGGVAEVRGRERAVHLGVSLSAGDEQVEQDRAPDVLPHRGELERAAVGESRGGGEFDRAHDDASRPDDPLRVGREQLSDGTNGER